MPKPNQSWHDLERVPRSKEGRRLVFSQDYDNPQPVEKISVVGTALMVTLPGRTVRLDMNRYQVSGNGPWYFTWEGHSEYELVYSNL